MKNESLELLKEIEAWLSFNANPSAEETGKLRASINRHIALQRPVGDVEILIKGLEHIGKWGDEEDERWDDPGDCAMDALTQYRYSQNTNQI